MSTFEGHTIFSIYFEDVRVYEQIYSQFSEMEFEEEENSAGLQVENSYLRRLIQILQLPTTSLLSKYKKQGETDENFLKGWWKNEDTTDIDSRGF